MTHRVNPIRTIIAPQRRVCVGVIFAIRVLFSAGLLIWVGLLLLNIFSGLVQVFCVWQPLSIQGVSRTWLATLVFLAAQAILVPVGLYLIVWGNRSLSRMAKAWNPCLNGNRDVSGLASRIGKKLDPPNNRGHPTE